MADGGVRIDVGLNVSKAERDLEKLKQRIAKAEQEISKNTEYKSSLNQEFMESSARLDEAIEKVRVLKEEYSNARGDTKAGIKEELTEALEEQKAITAETNRLQREYEKVSKSIAKGTENLSEMKEQAGAMESALEGERGRGAVNAAAAVDAIRNSMRKSVGTILKWGFGIRSAFVLLRRLRSAIKEGIKAFAEQDAETKANIDGLKQSLSTLKVAWGAAFAPIINAVTPLLQKLIDMLVSAANAVQMFFAMLSGAGTFQRVVKANDQLAESYEGAGGAASDAKKEIMGFDEINKLNAAGGGGGGGGAGAGKAWETVEEQIGDLGDSLLGRIGLVLKDIFFDLGDWNSEKFAEVVVASLSGLLGWFLAASLHLGPMGTIIFTIGGIILGLALDGLIFDHDKKLSKREVLDLVVLALSALVGGAIGFGVGGKFGAPGAGFSIGALVGVICFLSVKKAIVDGDDFVKSGNIAREILNIVLGGVAGFLLGGWTGAAIGVTVAIGLTLLLRNARLEADALDRFNQTTLGQTLSLLEEKVENLLTMEADLKVHIASITGEIDSATMADLAQAQALIDSIFTLDEKDNKTATELEVLQKQIEMLNSLGLDGLYLEFDETTGHVAQTREEVAALYDQIVQQYQLEAMHQAYVSAYQAEFDATRQVTQATEQARDAQSAYEEAVRNVESAQEALNEANRNYQQAVVDDNIADINRYEQAIRDAKDALMEAQEGEKVAEERLSQYLQALENAKQNYEDAYAKLDEIIDKYSEIAVDANTAGGDVQEGFAEGMKESSHIPVEESIQTCQELIDAIHTTLDENSPSGITKQSGENLMEGLAIGVEQSASRAITAVQRVMAQVIDVVGNAVQQISRIWQSDWGKPSIRVPVFQLYGMFDFMTGQVPQINVAGWRWLAKGGILDRATLIGAGEAGKEAIVPLERNTEWINLVADGLLDRLSRSPVANGSLVPPRAVGGSMFSDADIDRLARGIANAFVGNGNNEGQSIKLYLDGRQIAETVTTYQRRFERGYA